MKGNELMLGDWVILNYEGIKKVVRIIRLHQHYADVMTENDTEIQRVAYSLLEGMPLTEEILKANGFEYIQFKGWKIDDIQFTPSMELFVYKKHIKLSFVHKLQHALILCKLNELADNFNIK